MDVEGGNGEERDDDQQERDVVGLSDVAEQFLSVDEVVDGDEIEVGMELLPE